MSEKQASPEPLVDRLRRAGYKITPPRLAVIEVIEQEGSTIKLQVRKQDTAAITSQLLAGLPIADLTVEDPPIDEVIEKVFAQGQSLENGA